MSLVQYSSSDESSDDEKEVQSTSVEVKPTASNVITGNIFGSGSGTSISSFLPPPKNRQQPKREPRVLGKAIKSIAGESQVNPDNIVLEKSSKQVTSFIPSSLRNKKSQPKVKTDENTTQEKPEQIPKIELFQPIKTRPKSTIASSSTRLEVRAVIDDEPIDEQDEGKSQAQKQEQEQEKPTKKRARGQEEVPDIDNIKEFNVDQFYQNNIELKDQGLLQENKKLHTITHSKNQLSALVKNAKQDSAVLNERIEHNKKLKKERGDKYGW